jgi:hypothetical protein
MPKSTSETILGVVLYGLINFHFLLNADENYPGKIQSLSTRTMLLHQHHSSPSVLHDMFEI